MTLGAVPLTTFRWPSGDRFYVGALGVRVHDLAARTSVPVEHWEEEGLGPADGFALRLPSGRLVLFEELAHLVEHAHHRGPDVWADLREVARGGTAQVRHEVLRALALPATAFEHEPPADVDEIAAQRWAAQEAQHRAT